MILKYHGFKLATSVWHWKNIRAFKIGSKKNMYKRGRREKSGRRECNSQSFAWSSEPHVGKVNKVIFLMKFISS